MTTPLRRLPFLLNTRPLTYSPIRLSLRTYTSSSSSSAAPPQQHQQPHQKPTYFSLFPETLPQGPPPAGPFRIDTHLLRREFLKRQQSAHPDVQRHQQPAGPGASHPDKHLSALLNKAYTTLLNPLARAEYILQLRGIDISSEDAGSGGIPPAVVMEVVEVNEAIESATSFKQIEKLREENDERVRDCLETLELAFREDDLETARDAAVTLRFWEGVNETLKNWEPGKPIRLEH